MSGKFRKALDLLPFPPSSRKFSSRVRRAAAAKTVPTLALAARLVIATAFVLGQPVLAEPTLRSSRPRQFGGFHGAAGLRADAARGVHRSHGLAGRGDGARGQARAGTRSLRRAARLRSGRRLVRDRSAAAAGGRARRCDPCRGRRVAGGRLFRAEGLRPRPRLLGFASGFRARRRRSCPPARIVDVPGPCPG